MSLTGERLVSTKLEMPRINYRFNGKKYKYFYSVALMEGKQMKGLSEKIGTQTIYFLPGSKCDTYLLKTNVRTGETKKWFKQDFQVFEPVFIERPECRYA